MAVIAGVPSHNTAPLPTAVNKRFVLLATLVAATSGLLFGFDIAVINGAIVFLKRQFALTESQTELAASSLLIGCIFGAMFAGPLTDRFGRRNLLRIAAILFAVSAIGAAIPRTLTEFLIARFAGGLAIGVASVLGPLYIAEIAPAAIRGRLVSFNQMAIVSGILLAYFSNWVLSFQGEASWRPMFAVAAIPSVGFLIALFFVPESPRWLAERGRDPEALDVLTRVNGAAAARLELDSIRESISGQSGSWSELLEPRFRRALILGITLAILQQITGVNTILFYGSLIFREHTSGSGDSSAMGANVLIGLINFAATWIAIALMDKAGRRPLLIISSAVLGLSHLVIALAFRSQPPQTWLVLCGMLIGVAAFAVGLGPGVWVVLSEIFPNRVRGRALSVATIALWVACTVLTYTFLSLSTSIGITNAFVLYGLICFVTVQVVWRWVPETRGKTLEEIESLWRRHR